MGGRQLSAGPAVPMSPQQQQQFQLRQQQLQMQQQQAAAMRNARMSSLRLVTIDVYPPDYLYHLHPLLAVIRPDTGTPANQIRHEPLPPRQSSTQSGGVATLPVTQTITEGAPTSYKQPSPTSPVGTGPPPLSSQGRRRPVGTHQRSSSLNHMVGGRRWDPLVAVLTARSREVIWDPVGRAGPFRVICVDRVSSLLAQFNDIFVYLLINIRNIDLKREKL
jgi:hypothetical protein